MCVCRELEFRWIYFANVFIVWSQYQHRSIVAARFRDAGRFVVYICSLLHWWNEWLSGVRCQFLSRGEGLFPGLRFSIDAFVPQFYLFVLPLDEWK